ncbi:MAG: hypothetical protein O3B87_01960 [bacterium]|nr:hypothetical protein [bacterium]
MIATLRTFVLKRIPLLAFLIIYLFLALATYKDFGLTMDEFFVYTRGQYFYNKVVGNDAHLQKGFVLHEGGNEDLLFNNSSYPALLYMLNSDGTYEQYHLINILLASFVFILMYELLLFITKKPLYALIGPILLFLTPRFLGHIPANPKDIPFAIGYMTSMVGMLLCAKWDNKMRILILGILIGMTSAIRIVGLTLIPLYVLFRIVSLFESSLHDMAKKSAHVLLESLIIGLIAYLVFIFNMPYVGADPINHFIELLKVTAKYPWYGNIYYFGESIGFDKRPLMYLFVWIGVSTPLPILFLALYGMVRKMKSTMRSLKYLIVISLGMHMLIYIFLNPVIYNGLRHYLFLLPHFAILAALGYIDLLQNKRYKKLVVMTGILFAFMIMGWYVRFHPYQYTYFNILGNHKQFELDYWAASDKEAMKWLSVYLDENDISNMSVYSCSKSDSLNYYMPHVEDVNTNLQQADYIVCHDERASVLLKENIHGIILHEIKRENIVYSTIFKVERIIPYK